MLLLIPIKQVIFSKGLSICYKITTGNRERVVFPDEYIITFLAFRCVYRYLFCFVVMIACIVKKSSNNCFQMKVSADCKLSKALLTGVDTRPI